MRPGWYVLTGGPCAGKTTLLAELSRRGYRTVSEAARTYIDRELAKGRTIEEIRSNEVAFQNELVRMKVDTEKKLTKDEVIFFDRGMHDSVAYLALRGVVTHPALDEALKASRYEAVFLLDRVPYVKDNVRVETPQEAAELHERIGNAYRNAGMTVLRVPLMSLGKRADFILETIENL